MMKFAKTLFLLPFCSYIVILTAYIALSIPVEVLQQKEILILQTRKICFKISFSPI